MRAIVLGRLGGPEELEYREVRRPGARARARCWCGSKPKGCAGAISSIGAAASAVSQLPVILGHEFAGEVVAVGPGRGRPRARATAWPTSCGSAAARAARACAATRRVCEKGVAELRPDARRRIRRARHGAGGGARQDPAPSVRRRGRVGGVHVRRRASRAPHGRQGDARRSGSHHRRERRRRHRRDPNCQGARRAASSRRPAPSRSAKRCSTRAPTTSWSTPRATCTTQVRALAPAGVDVVLELTGSPTFTSSLRSLRNGGRLVLVGNILADSLKVNPGARDSVRLPDPRQRRLHPRRSRRRLLDDRARRSSRWSSTACSRWSEARRSAPLLAERGAIGRASASRVPSRCHATVGGTAAGLRRSAIPRRGLSWSRRGPPSFRRRCGGAGGEPAGSPTARRRHRFERGLEHLVHAGSRRRTRARS